MGLLMGNLLKAKFLKDDPHEADPVSASLPTLVRR
jgi:hypothetical protein